VLVVRGLLIGVIERQPGCAEEVLGYSLGAAVCFLDRCRRVGADLRLHRRFTGEVVGDGVAFKVELRDEAALDVDICEVTGHLDDEGGEVEVAIPGVGGTGQPCPQVFVGGARGLAGPCNMEPFKDTPDYVHAVCDDRGLELQDGSRITLDHLDDGGEFCARSGLPRAAQRSS